MDKKISFEDNIKKLEAIVAKMEDKNTTLDESLALFQQGALLSSDCMNVLSNSKGKVEEIIKQMDGITKVEFLNKE